MFTLKYFFVDMIRLFIWTYSAWLHAQDLHEINTEKYLCMGRSGAHVVLPWTEQLLPIDDSCDRESDIFSTTQRLVRLPMLELLVLYRCKWNQNYVDSIGFSKRMCELEKKSSERNRERIINDWMWVDLIRLRYIHTWNSQQREENTK